MIPCTKYGNCGPCNDPPITNLSSETPDVPLYWNSLILPPFPRLNETPGAPGGGTAVGDVNPVLPPIILPGVVPPSIPITDPAGDPIIWYTSEHQANIKHCADGGDYYSFLPAGFATGRSTAEANAVAISLLDGLANSYKICMSKASFPGCLYQNLFEDFVIDTGQDTAPFVVTLFAGSFPAGLVFDIDPGHANVIQVYGVPTAGGSGYFYWRIANSFGYLLKRINWSIMGITNAGILPDATNGDLYNYVLIGSGGTGNYDFSLASGDLPEGIDLDPTGVISGTPTIIDDEEYDFVVEINDGEQSCFYDCSINSHSY